MTSKQTKRIAFLLAASLLMNTAALPVSAESDVAIVEEAPTEAPTEAPVEIATESPTEAPTAEAATEAPTEAVTEAPTEEAATVPTETPTEEVPTEEATETPTGEAPTEEATEAPTEEPTEPLTREDILAAQQEGYQQALSHFRSMDISDDRTMSLEWWCVMTGNVSMREPDYSILDTAEGAEVSQEAAAEKTWADYIVFSEVISVRSASDLILLSYVSPSLYQNRTVTLFADAGNEFDLVHPLSVTAERTLNYRGMGDLGSPFSGTIRYAENSENITFVLDAPLFIGLSTKAKFLNSLNQPNTIFLVSKAGFAFDGLLARHILGEQQDEANWFIQLNAPDFTGGAVYVLPSLLGILYGNANVNLLLTDNSCLSPSPRGYLCATMYAQSSLSAWNITRSVSVPLVGEKADDAVLTTDAILPTEPTEEVTEPTEEVTEPTGEATEPSGEATEPTGEATEPTEETTEPTEEVTEPTEEVTEPTEGVTEPTEEVTEPTEEVTEPTEVTEPNQDATEPTEDATTPTQPGKIPMYYEGMTDEEFDALVAYYCAMPIVPGKMPLEWWFAVCGKLAELRAYLALKSQEPAPLPDEFDVKEVDSSTDSTLPTIITYPEPTEAETPAPTGASVQNEPEDVQAAEALDALLLDAPEAAAMADEPAAMAAEDAPAAMAETEDVPAAGAETEPPAAEIPLPEDSPAPAEATEATVATEATEAAEDNAAAEPAEDGAAAEPGDTTGADEGIAPQEEIKLDISSTDDLIKLSCVDAAMYQHETITVTASSSSINLCDKLSGGTTTFQGLGSDAAPFAGTFRYSGGSEKTSITLNRAFFNALSAGATIDHINLTWAGIVDESVDAAILALSVTDGTGTWTVNLDKHTGDTSTTENYRLPALIHTIAAGAAVTLTATNASTYPFGGQGFYCDNLSGTLTVNNPILPTFSTTKDNVGGLVGSMTGKATLNVNGDIIINVVTSGSTAGGFVGKMEDGATLKISGSTITVQQVSASRVDGSCVGTLVGVATNPNFTFENASITAGKASVTTGYHLNGRLVGGLVGKLTYSKEAPLSVLPIVGLKLLGHNCGGLFGELYNSSNFSLSYESATTLADVTLSGEGGSGGGLVGYYQASTAGASFSAINTIVKLVVDNQDGRRYTNVGGYIATADGNADSSITFENAKVGALSTTSTADSLGGFLGAVNGGSKLYLTLSSCTVENLSPAQAANSGGLVGKLGNITAHLKVTDSTVSGGSINSSNSAGGLVGQAEDHGHLIEVDTFTLTAANIRGNNCGGLVGEMKSGVVYMHSVPTLNITTIPSGASHGWIVGNRGNALVCSKEAWTPIATSNPEKQLNDTGIWGQVLQLSQFEDGLVTLDSQNHNVSIRALPQKAGDYYAINTLTDFASVALRLQLSPVGMLTIDSDISGGAVNLNLNTNIDLTGTSLTGLTRDNSVGEYYSFNIQGNDHTITLPNVKIFAGPGSHIFQGLIGQCRSGLTLNKLTVAGGSEIFCPDGQSTSVHCGIVGEMRSSATITSTNSSVSWTLGGLANNSNLSGFIAVTSVNNTIKFDGCSWTGSLVDNSVTDGGVCRLGGFIANGFYDENQKPSITVKNCTIGGTVRNTVSKDYEAAMGGLFGSLRYCQKLDINGLTVSTDFQSSSKKASGGLLGYELNCDDVTFSGVVINGAKLTTDTKFGGLIYKGAGHWTVKGIHFKSATISGQTDDKTPSGLLVSIGCSHTEVGGYEGLYLEVAHGAYKIEPGVKVTISGGKYFDELVGRSIYDASSGRNGIVSIATENAAPIDKDGCNTYKNQLQNWENPCTRYYYNLDTILAKADTSTTIDSPEEMVLWSAYNECRNCTKGGAIGGASASICDTFKDGNRNKITGTIDLKGYSFYPVVFDGTSIQDANITFSFKELDDAEANNKKPSDTLRQHAGMHTGIFKEITSKNAALTVNNLTLKGTVGSLGSSSGALVRDNVLGAVKQSDKDQEATQLNIENVTLSGIRVFPAPTGDRVSPLLIGSIGSHVKLQLTDMTTSGYGENTTAASSLIGNVGDSTATNIDLEFSKMNLSPDNNKADCKLFTHALFLESFQYSTGCRGVYNFTSKEKYTIGKEVSNTTTGRNPKKQHWFFYEWDTPSGLVAGENGADAAAFTRYVAQAETGSYHELDVNLQPLDLTVGCGTYSDPYRITDGKVLWEVAKALKQGGKNETWKVRINTAVLPSTGAAPDFSRDDGHTHDGATGEQELVLECDAAGKWHIADSTDTREINSTLMQDYLRNAYYMITSDIELPSEWTGLGTVSAPFRGVIVGQKEGGAIPTVTVTTTGAQQFGGLVLFSQGSVLRNLNIEFPRQGKFTISGVGGINSYGKAVFFGGVVGCCNAGDTVIDSVTVSLPAFSFPGYYVVIGGYVGLVGGANNQGGGGVVFRGSISTLNDPSTGSKYTYLYSGPYVGRVLDGYAVSETKIDNGNKNYQVPTLTSPILDFTDGTVTVGNGDGLWLLSAMENSHHGGAYTNNGKPRTCAYDTVGQSIPDNVRGDESGSGQPSFYLWKHYGKTTDLPTSFQLVFTGNCDMTSFGNGFRGIGVSQGTLRAYLNDYPEITGIDGGGHTVTLSQTREEPKGEQANWAAMGVGLFPVLNAGQNNAGQNMVIQNLNLTGTANLSVGDRVNTDPSKLITPVFHDGYQRTMVGAGMLAGALVNGQAGASITIQNVSASGSVVTNALMAGGLIGYCGSPVNGTAAFGKPASITVNGCNVSDATVKASSIFGGFIGFGYADAITIEGCTATGITLAATGPENDGVYLNGATTNNIANGVGGIIGTAYQNQLTICGITLSGLSLDIPNRQNANSFGFGGIVGSLDAFGSSSLTNINMQGVNKLYADGRDNNPPVGGLIGYLRNHTNPQIQLTISDVNIATAAGSKLIQRGYYDGGLVGLTSGNNLLLVGGAAENEAVRIGNASGNVTISKGDYNGFTSGANGFNSGVVSSTTGSLAMTIQNLHMTGVTVNGAALTSLVFAGVESTSATITLKNSEFISCKLDRNLDKASGYLFGSPWNGTIHLNGFNLLLKNCTTKAPGIFTGEVKGGSYAHLTAVSLVNCSGGARDFYSGNDAYAIRANYTGDQGYQNSSSNPWMDCNPLSDLNGLVDGITTPIAGNGAAFMADGKTPVASKIVEDSKTGSTIEASKRHYNASAAADFFAANDYGISISTFSAAGGNASTAGMPDFPVLVVPPLGRITASKSIYGYISMLTNTTTDATTLTSKLKGSITAQTYQWNEGKFTAITDSSITVEQDGTIHVMPGKYDNTLNQFTLLTVSYQDPTYAGNSYKLYIPIVVQKLLNYHFYASAISGTLYNRKPYETVDSLVVTTHGDQVTVLLSYVYDNGKTGSPAIAEWQNSIDNGDNLLWNFDKKIVVARDGNNDLPTGTKLTLVDRNNRDRAYYATYDGSGIIPLNSFKDAAGQPYEKNALCDAMGLEAKKDDNGLFVTTDKATATVRVGETYYRPAADSDTDTRYSITVGNAALLEEYYLTIQTPANFEELSNVKIQCEASLKNETGDTMLPNKFIEADSQHPYTRNNAENRILFGNFFQQTVTVTTNTPEEISDANNTINATLTVAINYKSDAWKERFAPYAQSIQLYQRFELQAMDWTGGTSASTSFTDRTATVRYLNGTTPVGSAKATKLGAEGIMVLKFPESVTVSTNTGLNAATLVAEVSLAYTSDQIQAQFHTRSNNTDGLQLWANSHLAFSDAALERSNNPTSGSDSKYFYRTESTPATLVYNANGTDVDARVNQLGVNGRVQDAASIDSVATYNVSVLDAAKNADTILYSIELYAKDDDGKFTQKIEDYSELLKVGNITATLADRNGTEKPVNFGEAFTGGIDPSIPIRISLPLTVVTGNGFTGTYANYKVNLRVWLQNGNAQITGSEATDYIIYTNAKIKFPLVTSD